MFASLFSWLAGIFTTSMIHLFSGWRALVGLLILTILGVVLYNLVVDIVEEVLSFGLSKLQDVSATGPPSAAVQFAGVGGYLATKLKVVECFAWVVNVTLLKWMLAKIPFIKW